MNQAIKTFLFALAFALSALPASAEPRKFPPNTRLGTLEIVVFPKARLDGKDVTLAPGTRIHDRSDLLALPATVKGPVTVLYRTDSLGQVIEAWILTPEELAKARADAAGAGKSR
jgi:hypothetical protein